MIKILDYLYAIHRALFEGLKPNGADFSLPVEAGGSFIDRSGTIVTANQSQPCMPANASRRYLLIQNHGSVDLWANVADGNAVAGQPSIRIQPGGYFEPLVTPRGAVAVLSTQQGLAYTAKEV